MRKAYAAAALAAGVATLIATTASGGGSPGFKTAQGAMIDPVVAGVT